MSESFLAAKPSWPKVAFGEVAQLSRERSVDPAADGFSRFIGLEHIDPADLRVRRWGNVVDGISFTNVFRPGQVLFGKRRAYQRKVSVPQFDGVCSSDIYVLEPKGDRLLPGLLPFICASDGFIAHAVRNSAGSLSPRTKWGELSDFVFRLPDRSAQSAILELLSASARLNEAYSDVADAAKVMRSAMLRRLGDVAGAQGKLVPIGELLVLRRTPIEPRKDAYYQEIGIRSFGKGVFHKDPCLGAAIGDKRVFSVEAGRLIFNVVFAWEGAVAMTSVADAGLIASHRFPMYEASGAHVSLSFLKYYFLTAQGLAILRDASPGGAGRNRTLGQDRFAQQRVPLPPLDIQLSLLNEMQAAEAALHSIQGRCSECKAVRAETLAACIGGE